MNVGDKLEIIWWTAQAAVGIIYVNQMCGCEWTILK